MRIWSRRDAEGYGRWGIRQNCMDNRKHVSSQLLKGYIQDLSNQTKVSRRAQFSEQKTRPEIQVYFLRALLTSLAQTKQGKNKILHRLFIEQVSGHNPDRYPSDKQARGEGPYSQVLLCPDVYLPGFHLACLVQSFCPVLKSSDYPSSE